MTKLPELLAPAGSPEALSAAIEGGADAVYFGGELFSNRMRAKNFSDDELVSAIGRCNAYGVASYITMNTRLRDRELPDAMKAARLLYEAGATAFIVADVGLAALMKRTFPKIELHASTQMTGVSASDAEAMASLGFTRMVCPRELSLGELTSLVRRSPIEIEAFIHGAHCVSLSGQCLMSWAMGGRSGNRGECAQPCRLPYRCSACGGKSLGGSAHPLSLKDMCLARYVPELIESGVASLKIEGRLKSPDYVYGVTKIYRTLLDEGRGATDEEIETLDRIFSRDGFTDGYFKGSFRRMTGMRPENAKSMSSGYEGLTKKIPLSASVTLKAGKASSLTMSCRGVTVTVTGDVVEEAKNAPISEDNVYKNISKLGGTYSCLPREDFTYITEGNVFIAASQLNDLRRRALSLLMEKLDDSLKRRDTVTEKSPKTARSSFPERITTASFTNAHSIPTEAWDYFDIIFLPEREIGKTAEEKREKVGLMLSPWTPDSAKLVRSLREFSADGGKHVLCHTLGQIAEVKKLSLSPVASFRLNVTSVVAAGAVSDLGAEYTVASPELSAAAVCAVSKDECNVGGVVYGKLPLMFLRRCIMSDSRCSGKCGRDGCLLPGSISDRRAVKLSVIPTGERTNVILNSNPIYMADRASATDAFAIKHFMFSVESTAEVRRIIEAYRSGLAHTDAGIQQMKRL